MQPPVKIPSPVVIQSKDKRPVIYPSSGGTGGTGYMTGTGRMKSFDFPITDDQFLTVNKSDLIQNLYTEFSVKMSPDDIRILKDGLQLLILFGPSNKLVSPPIFKRITDYFTSPGIQNVKFDDQELKLWIDTDPQYMFIDSGDERLNIVPSGVDAHAGTVQIELEESVNGDRKQLYTLVYHDPENVSSVIDDARSLCGGFLLTRPLMLSSQVSDIRIAIIRRRHGVKDKIYNDRIEFNNPIIRKVLVYV